MSPGDNCFVRRGDDETDAVADVINEDDLSFPRFVFPLLPPDVRDGEAPVRNGIY